MPGAIPREIKCLSGIVWVECGAGCGLSWHMGLSERFLLALCLLSEATMLRMGVSHPGSSYLSGLEAAWVARMGLAPVK